MDIKITTDFTKAHKLLAQLSGAGIRKATTKALTDAAFEARKVVQQEMDKSFDRVTPYIRRSITVKPATPDNLAAIVEPRYQGGKGIDPANVLRATIYGGQRKHKGIERAFLRVGILQPGYSIVPGSAVPLDQYGNIKASFVVQLISYFGAFGEQGYKANMTARRKSNLAKVGRSEGGYKTIGGVQYFVATGKLRGGRSSHLHAGIWSRSGIHGSNVKPIMMFVRTPSYTKRLDFFGKPVAAAVAKFNPRFRYHMRNIIEGKA